VNWNVKQVERRTMTISTWHRKHTTHNHHGYACGGSQAPKLHGLDMDMRPLTTTHTTKHRPIAARFQGCDYAGGGPRAPRQRDDRDDLDMANMLEKLEAQGMHIH
jgi:hypothetical protein